MKIEKDLLFYFYAIGYTRSALAKQSGKKLAELSQAIRAALQFTTRSAPIRTR